LQTALGASIMWKVTISSTSWEKESKTLVLALSKDWPSIKVVTQEVSLSLRQASENIIIYFLKQNQINAKVLRDLRYFLKSILKQFSQIKSIKTVNEYY
jgi:hypothetical protein